MTRTQEIRPNIDDGIDRKVLTQLRGRFLKVNSGRLARTLQALSTRQQLVLKLLPLLFHVNHPLLPGYVSSRTPAGLSGFEPDDTLLGLGYGAQAAHQEQAVNRQRGIATVGLIGERASQALGFAEQRVVWLEARQPGWRAAADIARQQRMVDVKQQRQQLEHQLLARRQGLQGTRQTPAVDLEKTPAQLRQHLSLIHI